SITATGWSRWTAATLAAEDCARSIAGNGQRGAAAGAINDGRACGETYGGRGSCQQFCRLVAAVPKRYSPRRTEARMATRIEKDTFGPIEVPADRLWGAQTQRSLTNFKIGSEKMPPQLVKALAQVKRAAAQVNLDLKGLDAKKAKAIIEAADEVIAGKHDAEFPLATWQTGSGTQPTMNMTEVLADRASAP